MSMLIKLLLYCQNGIGINWRFTVRFFGHNLIVYLLLNYIHNYIETSIEQRKPIDWIVRSRRWQTEERHKTRQIRMGQ